MTRARWLTCSAVAVVSMGVGAAVGLAGARRVIPLAERGIDAAAGWLGRRYQW